MSKDAQTPGAKNAPTAERTGEHDASSASSSTPRAPGAARYKPSRAEKPAPSLTSDFDSDDENDPTAQVDLGKVMSALAARTGEGRKPAPADAPIAGRFVLEGRLGRGGMGQVTRARDIEIGRMVAVKTLPPSLAGDADALHVFTAEARALAQANHPAVVAVYDVIRTEGAAHMIMELVDGSPLDDLIERRGRFPIVEAARIAVQLLAALTHLHERGLVHRDIKPGNIMVDRAGALRLTDFGLARHESRMKLAGTLVRGTPAYMSPEQIRGQELSAPTDIYAFGVTFFELLTGALPFDRNDPGFAHIEDPPLRIRQLRPDLPLELDAIVHRCLNKNPDSRPVARQLLMEILPFIGAKCEYLPPAFLPDFDRGAQPSPPDEATVEASLPPRSLHDAPTLRPREEPPPEPAPTPEPPPKPAATAPEPEPSPTGAAPRPALLLLLVIAAAGLLVGLLAGFGLASAL